MMRLLILGLALAFAASASAQLYRWVDKDGKVRYTDTPPPGGVKARTLGGAASAAPAASDTPDAAKKDAAKGPLTAAEQEQAFRKRQMEAQKAQEKADLARKDSEAKQENCARAREALATLESGQRISRTNAQGERYYLDDDARAGEMERARAAVRDWCN
nr:A79 [uncultured bacterium]